MPRGAASRRVPSPEGRWPFIGHTLGFHPQPLDFCLRAQAAHGDLVRFQVGFDDWFLVGDPKHVHRVLVTEAAAFGKPRLAKRLFRPFLGNGILSSDGQYWKDQHRLVMPGFHKKRIDAYGGTMVAFTDRMLDTWRDGERRDVCDDFTDLTLSIVGKTLFDADVGGSARRVGEAMEVINQVMVDHINLPLDVPRWWPTRGNRRKVKALDEFRGIVRSIIEERRSSGEDRGDLLSTLVFGVDAGGRRMSDSEVHDEAVTLFFAGHETTSIALTYMWYLLGRHPDIERRLHEELARVVGRRALTVDDLTRLPYLEMVVKESLRLMPPVWSYMREPLLDFEIDGYVIPKGSIVFICPYLLQHDARSFPDPEEFRPERFSPENEKRIVPGAYVPFAAGPRVCLGKSFASMEARLILGTIVQRCRIGVPDDYRLAFHPRLSLRPKHGMTGTIELRSKEGEPRAAGRAPATAEAL